MERSAKVRARGFIKKIPGAVPLVRSLRTIRGGRQTYPPDWGYQQVDWEVADYDLYRLPGSPIDLRGPAPEQLIPRTYITCVGAAQTFGRFCPEPFPQLLSERLQVPVVNLGYAGAGPLFFLGQTELMRCISDSRLVVIQVMSARSEDNTLFDSRGLEYLTVRSTGERIGAGRAYERLLRSDGIDRVRSVVDETRRNWITSYEQLFSRIPVRKILFWFSVREPDYVDTYDNVSGLFGKFPDMVNKAMVETISTRADAYVECATARGLPQELRSRFTGRRTSVPVRADLGGRAQTMNSYYPSPEMHHEAAETLAPFCRRFLEPGT